MWFYIKISFIHFVAVVLRLIGMLCFCYVRLFGFFVVVLVIYVDVMHLVNEYHS